MRFVVAGAISIVSTLALLLGWGDFTSYWRDAPRAIVAAVMLVAPPLVALLAPNAGTGVDDHVREQRIRILMALLVLLPICYAFVALLDRREYFARPEIEWLRWAGLAVFLLGWCMMLWSVRELGRHYSIFVTRQTEHRLVRTGPYTAIRHPIYLGFIVWMLGFALVFRSWGGAFVWLLAVVGAVRKLRREERYLNDEFPQTYGAYSENTWRLIPYIY